METKWTDHCEARLTDKEIRSRGPWQLPQNPWEAVGDRVAKNVCVLGGVGGGLRLEGRESCELHLVASLTYLCVCVGRLCPGKQGRLSPSRLSPASESPRCLGQRGNGLNSPWLVGMKDVL